MLTGSLIAMLVIVLVVGAANSSNSVRLVEVALRGGARDARLIADAAYLDFAWFEGVRVLGLTAGASAPEDLVQGVIAAVSERFSVEVEPVTTARETITFKLPRAVA